MSPANHVRIGVDFHRSEVIRTLKRRFGEGACWNLVRLLMWAAENRPTGCLSGLDDTEIEKIAGWKGAPGDFVMELCSIGYLQCRRPIYCIRGWEAHLPEENGGEGLL